MKYLGIDFGGKRVGIAVSDEAAIFAFPRTTVDNDAQLLATVVKIIEDEKIQAIVVGDTLALSGAPNPISTELEKFIEALSAEISLPVTKVHEAWSSIEASRYAPEGKGHDDAAAAAIILQRFLDMRVEK